MKILFVDIETSPHLSWHFGRWKQNIPAKHTVKESRVLCWAAKWAGKKKVHFMSSWHYGHEKMMQGIWELMDEADVVIGYNSKKFDVKRLNSEFIRLGWEQPSPYEQVDLLQQVKKHFAFSANRLDDVLEELGLEKKQENRGFALWMDVMDGKRGAQSEMRSYNIQDVKVTEELYMTIRGWISPHPNWGLYIDDDNPTCLNCGSTNVVKHKIRRTKVRKYQQYHCNDCGSYHRGRKSLESTGEGVLT
jgi:DNA polymerase elongation subunit (family B)